MRCVELSIQCGAAVGMASSTWHLYAYPHWRGFVLTSGLASLSVHYLTAVSFLGFIVGYLSQLHQWVTWFSSLLCVMLYAYNICRAMLCISVVCAVMQCPSVCVSVTFMYSVETNKLIFKIFSPSGSQTILVFPYQMLWIMYQYQTSAVRHCRPRPMPHCRVMPPCMFNDMIPEPLPICSHDFMMITIFL